jgi:hypothetical protein
VLSQFNSIELGVEAKSDFGTPIREPTNPLSQLGTFFNRIRVGNLILRMASLRVSS